MALNYFLLDVFADRPFQGTPVPVVVVDGQPLDPQKKVDIAGEFQQTETVYVETNNSEQFVSVYNSSGETHFGAHTVLAAAYVAADLGMARDEGSFAVFRIMQQNEAIDCFIDRTESFPESIQFARTLSPQIDRYTPEVNQLADCLTIDAKHISFSKYLPMVVSVDHPILIIPFTRARYVQAARLNLDRWNHLLSEVYTSELLLFAPGTLTGSTNFHGRLVNSDLAPGVFPSIGGAMPEFIAYLAEQKETAIGTHTFTIDRGSDNTRKSVLNAEFDKRPGRGIQCRIGGNVLKIGEGSLLIH
jgi:trans-2,3-dihydro-3-hydroxyanthranilate isomerase